jgi:hypothetical protein
VDGGRRGGARQVWWAIAAGVLLYVSAFFTFALLAALPLALLSAMTAIGGSAGSRPPFAGRRS